MRRVYSYIRFSTPEQADGHSLQRQLDYAQRYAEEHGLMLDESLSLRDEGLSAYHQAHVTRGALGTFLQAVDAGMVPKGSILIVEGLDRLSRAEPIESQAQLAQIINAGITVVTASDNKTYSRESLKANPMDLIFSLLIMIRAHEESDTKSRRVRQAIHARVERWLNGKEKGIIRQGRDPRWVRALPDLSGFEVVPEFAAGVRFIVAKYIAGWGAVRITEAMTAEGISAGTEKMERGTVYRIIRNPALIGENRIEVDGVHYKLPGYYPAVISEGQWHELQARAVDRKSTGRVSKVPPILTGVQITRCGYCGHLMTGQNTLNKMKADGTLPEYARRILCTDANQWRRCAVNSSVAVGRIERAVLEYCADTLNLSALVDDDNLTQETQAQLNKSLAKKSEVAAAIERMTNQFLKMDAVPSAFINKVNALEKELSGLEVQVESLRSQVAALNATSRPDLLQQWQSLKTDAMALDAAARLQVRELIRQTFHRIDVYIKGFEAAGDGIRGRIAKRAYAPMVGEPPQTIDLVLHGRSGVVRILAIDKKSGAWRAATDFNVAQILERGGKIKAER